MKRTIFVIFLCFFIVLVSAQEEEEENNGCKCSELIAKISSKWKFDSLAENGYRLSVHRELKRCLLDSISTELLLKKLGKPNEINQYYSGSIGYSYNYYDYKHRDTTKIKWIGYGYNFITFTTDTVNKKIISIYAGTGEY